jgi:aspartyl-tRNA(Asn)/glutamyl-tRNA(Gln) amidotransferase subunit B
VALATYYEDAVHAGDKPKTPANWPKSISNWIMTDILREVDGSDDAAITALRGPLPPRNLAQLVTFIDDGTISGKIAKERVLPQMLATGQSCETLVRTQGLTQVADTGALEAFVEAAIAGNPKAVADFKAGKTAAAKALVGQVMKASGGRANPAMVDRLVQEKLSRI